MEDAAEPTIITQLAPHVLTIVALFDFLCRTNASWGLSRIGSKTKLTGDNRFRNYTYRYDSRAGEGVDVYIVSPTRLSNVSSVDVINSLTLVCSPPM